MASQDFYLETFILVMTAATFVTRLVPFVFFSKLKDSRAMIFVGRYLPLMVMPILVVYSLKDTTILPVKSAIPEAVAVAAVVGVHLWRANALLSIALGTAVFVWLKHYSSMPLF